LRCITTDCHKFAVGVTEVKLSFVSPSHCPHAPALIITLRLTRIYGPLVGPLVDPMADGQWQCAVRDEEPETKARSGEATKARQGEA